MALQSLIWLHATREIKRTFEHFIKSFEFNNIYLDPPHHAEINIILQVSLIKRDFRSIVVQGYALRNGLISCGLVNRMTQMIQKIKLFTHERIIHAQVVNLEKILNRSIDCTILLNNRESGSSIQFDANDQEIEQIKMDLGCTIMVLTGKIWMPYI